MTGQRAQKEWATKSGGKVETEAAVKRTQCYLMFAPLTTLSPSSPIPLLGLIAVQAGLYLGLSYAICGVMFERDHSLT